jgi:hypothetical protein
MNKFAEEAIVDYLLSFADQGKNKLPFSVSVCSKQTEVCLFRFPFTVNKRKLTFFFSSIFGISETWRHGHGIKKYQMENRSPCERFP